MLLNVSDYQIYKASHILHAWTILQHTVEHMGLYAGTSERTQIFRGKKTYLPGLFFSEHETPNNIFLLI